MAMKTAAIINFIEMERKLKHKFSNCHYNSRRGIIFQVTIGCNRIVAMLEIKYSSILEK